MKLHSNPYSFLTKYCTPKNKHNIKIHSSLIKDDTSFYAKGSCSFIRITGPTWYNYIDIFYYSTDAYVYTRSKYYFKENTNSIINPKPLISVPEFLNNVPKFGRKYYMQRQEYYKVVLFLTYLFLPQFRSRITLKYKMYSGIGTKVPNDHKFYVLFIKLLKIKFKEGSKHGQ